jgi:hypothetical protein
MSVNYEDGNVDNDDNYDDLDPSTWEGSNPNHSYYA